MVLQQISHYRVDRLLGAGGMGEVYLAEDETLRRKVALKLLPERFSDDGERVRRFQREARAASALNHPNIITIYEIGMADSRHYIATEYIEGVTLRDRIASKTPMSIGDVLDIAIGVTNALSAAHEAGIVHRDIKPENIMLRPDGYVKVLDFGLAKVLDTKDSTTGQLIGTLMYISPEQARGGAPDARSDIYGLGVVIYEMLTRRPPHVGENFMQLAMAIAKDEIKPPSTYALGLPSELDRIVMKALEKDRNKRYQRARELLDDLRVLRQELEFENKLVRHTTPAFAHQETQLLSFPPVSTTSVIALWKTKPWVRFSAIGAIVLAVLITAVAFLGTNPFANKPIDSVAVLPFTNATGNAENDYLSDGIAESVIDSLSQLPELRVVARSTVFHYKGRSTDPLVIGRELKVRGVVTGRLQQRGDTIIVRATLADVKHGTQVWGEQYETTPADVLTLQQELAEAISNKLRMQLSGEEKVLLTKRSADNPEAYQNYLKGRYHLTKADEGSTRRAIAHFNRSIEIDPTYALAYAGLADAYYGLSNIYMAPHEAMPRAREAAKRALELDDSLAPAHTSLALVLAWYDWDFARGEREFRRAIALNPADSEAHHVYGTFLTALGKYDQAVDVQRKAVQLDALSAPASYALARTLFFAGRHAEARQQLRATLELNDRYARVYLLESQIALAEGRVKEAFEMIDKATAVGGRTPLYVSMRGYIDARTGNREGAIKAVEELKARPNYLLPLFLARIHAGLGENDEAMRWLEQAHKDRSESIVWLKVDPTFVMLRSDPRFMALLKRVGL